MIPLIKKQSRIQIIALPFLIGSPVLAFLFRWTADDAFISFRYARNAARGEGLVFNTGEYVEGFTNFLWTLFFVPAHFIFEPAWIPTFSHLLSLAFFTGLLFWFTGNTFSKDSNSSLVSGKITGEALPLTLIATSVHPPVLLFSTSGLETIAFTAMATSGAILFTIQQLVRDPKKVFAGLLHDDSSSMQPPHHKGRSIPFLLFTIASLFRPDGMVFYASFALLDLFVSSPRWKSRNRFSFVVAFIQTHQWFFLIFAPYWMIRWWYFGRFFPNTFYAKSAYEPTLSRGLDYIASYGFSYPIVPIALMLILLISLIGFFQDRTIRRLHLLLFPLFSWIAYIVYVGGDFMFARFLLPIIPLLFFFFHSNVVLMLSTTQRMKSLHLPFRLILAIILSLPGVDLFQRERHYTWKGVTEEWNIYRAQAMRAISSNVEGLAPVVRSSGVRIAFWGGEAFIIYYMDPVYALESETGLTDEDLAKQKRIEGLRAGHDKHASRGFLLQKDIHISLKRPENPNSISIYIQGLPGPFELLQPESSEVKRLLQTSYFSRKEIPDPR